MCFLLIQELFRDLSVLLPSPPTNCPFLILDDLPPSQYTDTPNPNSRTDSGRMLRHGVSTSKPETSHNIQSDQLHRGVVLGPPGSPQGVKSVSQAQKDDRLKRLEKRLEEMARMLDMIKAQVTNVLLKFGFS